MPRPLADNCLVSTLPSRLPLRPYLAILVDDDLVYIYLPTEIARPQDWRMVALFTYVFLGLVPGKFKSHNECSHGFRMLDQ